MLAWISSGGEQGSWQRWASAGHMFCAACTFCSSAAHRLVLVRKHLATKLNTIKAYWPKVVLMPDFIATANQFRSLDPDQDISPDMSHPGLISAELYLDFLSDQEDQRGGAEASPEGASCTTCPACLTLQLALVKPCAGADIDRWLADAAEAAKSCANLGLHTEALSCIMSCIGLESIKQFNAAAGLLQKMQHMLLYGKLSDTPITQDDFVKDNFKIRRATENARNITNLEDAASREYQVLGDCLWLFNFSMT